MYNKSKYFLIEDELSYDPIMLVTLLDLITHRDDNFRRKSPVRIFIVISSIFLLPWARAGRFHSSQACNRSREVLSGMSGTISDGPSYLNYTGDLM